MKKIAIIATCMLVSGCALPQTPAQEVQAAFRAVLQRQQDCQTYGLKKDTPEFNGCMIALTHERAK